MSEMVQKAALALVDNPLTTTGVMLTGAGSAVGRFLELLPDIISVAGGIIALLAGAALIVRHGKSSKLVDLRREGAKMQNAHDAKMHEHSAKMRDIELERVQLELDNYKAENV